MMLILNVWQERCYFYHKLMFLHIGQDLEEDKHSTQQTNITFKEICQFGIRKFPKKLVISLLFCNFIVENQ